MAESIKTRRANVKRALLASSSSSLKVRLIIPRRKSLLACLDLTIDTASGDGGGCGKPTDERDLSRSTKLLEPNCCTCCSLVPVTVRSSLALLESSKEPTGEFKCFGELDDTSGQCLQASASANFKDAIGSWTCCCWLAAEFDVCFVG